ncbi:MAG: ATP-binding protein [Clostridiales bacterium]|nr:ATP-binding protein [Clostridiales bacterium]
MSRRFRLIFLAISLLLLTLIGWLIYRDFSFIISDFWFTSGLLLLILLSLIDQPFFSKDSNIFVNGVTAFISLLLVQQNDRTFIFWLLFSFILYLLVSSYILMWIRNNPLKSESGVIQLFSRLNRLIGSPQVVFSGLFLFGIFKQFSTDSRQFNALLLYWIAFLILNISEIAKTIEKFFLRNRSTDSSQLVGETFGVLSKNIFLTKKIEGKTQKVSPFDLVEFNYSVDGKERYGIVLENYLLKQEQWIKILASSEVEGLIAEEHNKRPSNMVYKIECQQASVTTFKESFVGVIIDNTLIEKIRFQYLGNIDVFEGQLLEINIRGHRVFYQILEGLIKTELLDNKDEASMVIGEAFQLGEWVRDRGCFEQFGWIPDINTPVFLATDNETGIRLDDNECEIGEIPKTNYKVVMNCTTAITHHMAILGVTGSGKSVFARQVIRSYLCDENVRVICVDFTSEYARKFQDLAPYSFGARDNIAILIGKIHALFDMIEKHYGRESEEYFDLRTEILVELKDYVKTFLLQTSTRIGVFELPEMENTSAVMVYIQLFFKAIFEVAKETRNYGNKVSLVLEEAHTVIPEWNFAGVNEKFSQPVLNSIAQIALQGRKYNIGLLVIAQRSAIVSKTILSQCNSIVTFQGFDKTSIDFLAAYFGTEVASSISRLKFRQAYAVGKAFRSSVPLLFEVPFIESESTNVEENSAARQGEERAPLSVAYPTPRTVDPTPTQPDV